MSANRRFFGYLTQLVYANNWSAKNTTQLKRRINYCLNKVDNEVVKAFANSAKIRLKKVGHEGPMSVIH